MDKVAQFLGNLKDEAGEPIPVIFQPFHGHDSDTALWWSTTQCSASDFKNLWKLTVNYLQNEKDVHNLLYAYSVYSNDPADILPAYYPGNDFVDIIGINSLLLQGDGDLSVWAGANYFMGNNSDQVQLSTLCFSVANVDSYGYTTNPNLYWENKDSPIHDALKSGKYPLIDQHSCNNLIGPSVVQFNAGHIAMTNSTDPWQISDAMVKGRKVAAEYLRMLKDYQPQVYGNAFIVKTASLLGIRESRRIEGDYVFSIQDWLDRKSFDDEIGRNCYFVDIHIKGYEAKHYGRGESHGIPYRILTPKGIKNLLTAGRCISTDEEALGSLRVMPPSLVTGEAAGLAAALAIKQSKNDVHNIDVDFLRKRLREEGQYFK